MDDLHPPEQGVDDVPHREQVGGTSEQETAGARIGSNDTLDAEQQAWNPLHLIDREATAFMVRRVWRIRYPCTADR